MRRSRHKYPNQGIKIPRLKRLSPLCRYQEEASEEPEIYYLFLEHLLRRYCQIQFCVYRLSPPFWLKRVQKDWIRAGIRQMQLQIYNKGHIQALYSYTHFPATTVFKTRPCTGLPSKQVFLVILTIFSASTK